MTERPSEHIRVYRWEWTVVHFVMADDDGGSCPGLLTRLETYFDEHYAGKVRVQDVAFSCTGTGINAVSRLLLRLPVLKGEFRTWHLADAYVRQQDWHDAEVVARNSAAEEELRSYGLTRLA